MLLGYMTTFYRTNFNNSRTRQSNCRQEIVQPIIVYKRHQAGKAAPIWPLSQNFQGQDVNIFLELSNFILAKSTNFLEHGTGKLCYR